MRKIQLFVAGLLALLALPLLAQNSPTSLVPAPELKQEPANDNAAPPTSQGRPATSPQLDATDVNTWLDGFLPYAIAKGDIPGGVVVVVKDGAILTQRGYGFADLAKRAPVDPARTLLRPGSVSKLFTWTAVMQQVEQGKLNLDQDVNAYLDFKIPPRDGQPITLRQIMKHTAGFEEALRSIITTKPEDNIAYDTLLKNWTPERVYAPGSTPAYSNYATALAGYIVQRVSGEKFDDYVERHIFQPLGMAHTTFRQPLPPRLKPLMATGYISGVEKPYGFEFVGPAPAGSVSASGEDMGRFMIAHLQGGSAGGKQILKPETARLMHTSVTKPLPGLNGMALGFYETNINGRRVIAHGGDTVAFHSDLHLFLDEGVGLYVSFNSAGKEGAVGDLRNAIFEKFADRYFPGPAPTLTEDPKAAELAQSLAGTWSTSRRAHSSFLAILDLLGQAKIGVGEKNKLLTPFSQGLNGQPHDWVAVSPGLWRDRNSYEMLAAQLVDGKPVRFSVNSAAPIMVWDRTPWHKDSAWLLPLAYFSLAALLLTALFWPVRALVRRRFGSTLALEKRELLAYRGSRIAAASILALIVAWGVLVATMMGDISNLSPAFDAPVLILEILSILIFLGGLGVMLWNAWAVWRSKQNWKAKAWSVVLVISALTFVWIGFAFNLIDLGTNY